MMSANCSRSATTRHIDSWTFLKRRVRRTKLYPTKWQRDIWLRNLLLQCCEFLVMRKADAHVAGRQPGIVPPLPAARAHVAGWAFVVLIRPGPVHRLLEDFPPLLDRSLPQVVFGDGEAHAEVHLPVGGDRKLRLPACALDEGPVPGAGLINCCLIARAQHGQVNTYLVGRTEAVLQGTGVPVGFGVDVQAVLEFDSHSFNEGAGVLDFMSRLGHDRHANDDWQSCGYKALQPADEQSEGSWHAGNTFVRVFCRAVDRDGEAAELRSL